MTQSPRPIPVRPRPDVPHKHFARAAFAHTQARATGKDAKHFIRDDDHVSPLIIQRANASPGTTTAAGWALELARDAWRNYLTEMAPYSGAARLIAIALKATAGTVNEAKYPVRANGPAVPAWVAEGAPIPVRSSDFDNIGIGPTKKMSHILAWSRELSKRSDADAIFEQMLREDLVAGLDSAFFATSAGSTAAHAGLLNGVTASTASTAMGRAAIEDDLSTLSTAVATGGSGNVTFVMRPERLALMRIRAPELVVALDIAASAAVPADRVIAADGAALLVSVDEAPEILVAAQGVVHMSDVPLEIVSDTGPTTADPVRSIWQTATVAVRVIHELAFAKRRSMAVAYLDGAQWT